MATERSRHVPQHPPATAPATEAPATRAERYAWQPGDIEIEESDLPESALRNEEPPR